MATSSRASAAAARARARAHHALTKLAEARQHDALLHVEAYCDEPGCPTREVHLHLKDHDHDLVRLVRQRGGLHCPVCGASLKLHWVRTARAHAAVEDQDARANVAFQMFVRDHNPSPGDDPPPRVRAGVRPDG